MFLYIGCREFPTEAPKETVAKKDSVIAPCKESNKKCIPGSAKEFISDSLVYEFKKQRFKTK